MSVLPPVTMQRVEAWLGSQGLAFDREPEEGVHVALGNAHLVLMLPSEGAFLFVRGIWLGVFPPDQVDELNDLADLHYQQAYGPRMSLGFLGDGNVRVITQMLGPAGQGMSDAQLADFLDLAVRMNMSLFADLEERYPGLVDWESWEKED